MELGERLCCWFTENLDNGRSDTRGSTVQPIPVQNIHFYVSRYNPYKETVFRDEVKICPW